MNNPPGVCKGKSIGNLAEDANCVRNRKLTLTTNSVAQRLPLDVWHYVIQEALRLAGVVQWEDVGVLQLGGYLDLANETLMTNGCGQFGTENFDCHFPVMSQVSRQEDGGHSPLSNLSFDRVAIGESGSEAFLEFRHTSVT